MKPLRSSSRPRTYRTRVKAHRYWIEARDQGEDLHILVGRRDGTGVKAHFVIDARTAEIRVENQKAVPEDLITSIESVLSMRDGATVRSTRHTSDPAWTTVAQLPASSEAAHLDIPGFGASIVQTGGVGARLVTSLAWILTEHGYLRPSEVLDYFFNGPGDFLVVAPHQGFVITSAESPTGNDFAIYDDGQWCGFIIEDKLKNTLVLECGRRPSPPPTAPSVGA